MGCVSVPRWPGLRSPATAEGLDNLIQPRPEPGPSVVVCIATRRSGRQVRPLAARAAGALEPPLDGLGCLMASACRAYERPRYPDARRVARWLPDGTPSQNLLMRAPRREGPEGPPISTRVAGHVSVRLTRTGRSGPSGIPWLTLLEPRSHPAPVHRVPTVYPALTECAEGRSLRQTRGVYHLSRGLTVPPGAGPPAWGFRPTCSYGPARCRL